MLCSFARGLTAISRSVAIFRLNNKTEGALLRAFKVTGIKFILMIFVQDGVFRGRSGFTSSQQNIKDGTEFGASFTLMIIFHSTEYCLFSFLRSHMCLESAVLDE